MVPPFERVNCKAMYSLLGLQCNLSLWEAEEGFQLSALLLYNNTGKFTMHDPWLMKWI